MSAAACSGNRTHLSEKALISGTARLCMFGHERLDAWCDLDPEPGAVEDAIMANTGLQIVLFLRSREIRCEFEGRKGLTAPGNVVLLTLDGHQGTAANLP